MPRDTFEKREQPTFGKLERPYEHGETDIDAYLDKASLSPWVPIPDVIARKIFDLANAGPEDHHVDLGSGDGRVCFHALQHGVASTVGIDIDEGVVNVAKARLAKRHPAPPNLSFLVADLLDPTNEEAWSHVQKATLISMYFATPGLEKLRPLLEQKLAGRSCKIVTCEYQMPGWESEIDEIVLGTQISLYQWGQADTKKVVVNDAFFEDHIIMERPLELKMKALEGEKFRGGKITDRTGNHPVRGFYPEMFDEEEDDDEVWDFVNGEEDEEDEDVHGDDAGPDNK
jgi:SAM-dependent methyltransferase